MPSRISIAVCTYNGERFLSHQLDSLLAQTLRPDEIILRDDVSSDATMQIVEAFLPRAQALGIHVDARVNPANLGYRGNFQEAISACTSDLIFLCDQDDVWEPDKLQLFVDAFEARPDLLALHSDGRLIDAAGAPLPGTLFGSLKIPAREVRLMHQNAGLQVLLRRNLMTGAAMAFRRDVLHWALPLPPQGWVHDAWIAVVAAMHGSVDSLEQKTIAYRLHDGNQLGVGGPMEGGRRAYRQRLLESELINTRYLLEHRVHAGVPDDILPLLHDRITHFEVRSGLPGSLLSRLVPVLRELFSGRYRRYSRGSFIAAADLLGL